MDNIEFVTDGTFFSLVDVLSVCTLLVVMIIIAFAVLLHVCAPLLENTLAQAPEEEVEAM